MLPALLSPLIVIALSRVAQSVYSAGEAVCGAGPVPTWQTLWVPVQVTALVVCVAVIVRSWPLRED